MISAVYLDPEAAGYSVGSLTRDVETWVERMPGASLHVGRGDAWASPKDYHRAADSGDLRRAIQAVTRELCARARDRGCDVARVDCWANALGPGARIERHTHGEAVECAVLYLRCDPEAGGRIVFPRAGTSLVPRPGWVVLFRGDEPHEVATYRGAAGLRISLAFNGYAPVTT